MSTNLLKNQKELSITQHKEKPSFLYIHLQIFFTKQNGNSVYSYGVNWDDLLDMFNNLTFNSMNVT